jgi:hypothetical protein
MNGEVPKVDQALIVRACQSVTANKRSMSPAASIMASLAAGLSDEQIGALIYRFLALNKLTDGCVHAGWKVNIEGVEYLFSNEALHKAAAVAPLRIPEKPSDLGFDPILFSDVVLAVAKPGGSA